MKMLILGSTGMLGMALYRRARSEKVDVVGAARSGADRTLDVTDAASLERLILAEKPAVVVNTVAITNLDACERDPASAYLTNTRPAAVVADACRGIGALSVHISTDHYYTGDERKLHKETDPVRLLNEYARTKYAAEAFALTAEDSLVLRTNIVGFRNRPESPTFTEWCIRMLQEKIPATLFDDFYTSPIDVNRFSEILFDLLGTDATGILNIAGRDVSSKQEFILDIAGALGLDVSHTTTGSVRGLAGTRRAESLALNVHKAEKILGYLLPDRHEVIGNLAREYQKEH